MIAGEKEFNCTGLKSTNDMITLSDKTNVLTLLIHLGIWLDLMIRRINGVVPNNAVLKGMLTFGVAASGWAVSNLR